ncbi:MAG: hypothetical protein HPZ91_09280 [Lentisphaeria bacterium]|nr:hypothetical protein [Lentisphaeria bacterium]
MKLLSIFHTVAFLTVSVFCVTAEDQQDDPFPPFETLPAPLQLKQGAKITISPEGHFLVDGVPRYLEGTIFYEGVTTTVQTPTAGYPANLKWLYETTQDYRDLQRIGFDTVGSSVPNLWIDKYRPEKNYSRYDLNWSLSERFLRSGLPVYIDFTCAPWHHGALTFKEGCEPGREAFAVPGEGNNHWVPYSLSTPAGRNLWLEMWTYGARYMKERGIHPFVYELFNEPDYNDWSDFNRRLFCERMNQKYNGDISALNREWHTAYPDFDSVGKFEKLKGNIALQVEWGKFMEELFTQMCADGVAAIKKIDPRPEAGFCVQPLSLQAMRNVNMYAVNRYMNMVCSPTGGGQEFFQGHFLRAIADGKPIFDGETYLGTTRKSHRDKIWTQYARGFNASYVFKWDRRTHEPVWQKPDGGKRLAEIYPYLMLNPYAVPTEALLGLMDAKREILAVNDLFTPRDRGVTHEVALLFSYPTMRYTRASGYPQQLANYTCALEYSQFPIDFLLEEQLPEGRQARYRAIVAPGVSAVLPESAAYLEKYVRNGGILILGQEALQCDEYGFAANRSFPGIKVAGMQSSDHGTFSFAGRKFSAGLWNLAELSEEWRELAQLNKKGVLFSRKFGRGEVFFLNARMPQQELGSLLGTILAKNNIKPSCEITDALNGEKVFLLEVTKARRNGKTGYIIFNRGMTPRFVRFHPGEQMTFCDPYGKLLLDEKDGAFLLRLMPEERVVVIGGDRDVLERDFGPLTQLSYADAEKAGSAWLEENQPASSGPQAFRVTPATLRFIDLRKAVNRAFEDRFAGDSRGGWTDQGDNSLHGVPWGVQNCNGVLFDFIRPDQNEERGCIVLASRNSSGVPAEVRGLEVDLQAEALYFLHAGAWLEGNEEGFRYIIHYADGSALELPIRANIETGDWFHVLDKISGMECVPGFVNSEKKGLFVWKWRNPSPEKTIASIDIISAGNSMVPIIAGITAETTSETSNILLPLLPSDKKTQISAARGVTVNRQNNGLVADFSNAGPWSSFRIQLPEAFQLPLKYSGAALEMELSAPGGKVPALQVRLDREIKYVPLAAYRMEAEKGVVPVFIPLSVLVSDIHQPLAEIAFQVVGKQEPAQVTISQLGIRAMEKEDPFSIKNLTPAPWGKLQVRRFREFVELFLDDSSINWCGTWLRLQAPVPVSGGVFSFEVNGGTDSWGKQDKGKQKFQVRLRYIDSSGQEKQGDYVPVNPFLPGGVDAYPGTWQQVQIPLNRLLPKEEAGQITAIAFQFETMPAERCGIQLRNFITISREQ